ncbi:MAG TPA: formimidoylglutamase [Flavobacteriales bacterium]|nr:formimidoylglutamase [Flavobacteriales bacterium]
MNTFLKTLEKQELEKYYSIREGETKLGQTILTPAGNNLSTELANSSARFVLVGIPEDIGVRANFGKPGTAGFFNAFLCSFATIQSNDFLTGEEILLAGTITCHDLMQQANEASFETLSTLVNELDKRVESVLSEIFAAGKTAIVIGGGHNNAYPIIKALSSAREQKISVVNIDPHADLRNTERRHSGNGFSYSLNEELLDFYLHVGLHENHNNRHILDLYAKNKGRLHYFSYDDYLRHEWNFNSLDRFVRDVFVNKVCGFELDCDSIVNMPSSAVTPSGFSPAEARQLTIMLAKAVNPAYFHLPEAIAATEPLNSSKLAAYLVTDFIKAMNQVN